MRKSIVTVTLGLTMCTIGPGAGPPPPPKTHTATSTAGGFNSRDIQAHKSWKFTIQETGEFAYLCTLHPTMKPMLRVKS